MFAVSQVNYRTMSSIPDMEVGVLASSILEEAREDAVLEETNEENLLEALNLGQGSNVMGDDGLASDREQGLGDIERQGAETRAARGTADEDDGLGIHFE